MSELVIVDPNAYGGHNDFCHSLSLLLSGKDMEIIYLNRESISKNTPAYEHIAVGYPDASFKNKIKSYVNIYRELKKLIKEGYIIHFQDITPYMIPIVSLLLLQRKNKNIFYYTLHNIKPHGKSFKDRIEYKIVYLLLQAKAFKKVFYHFEFIKMKDEFVMNNIPPAVQEKMVFVPHHMFRKVIWDKAERQRLNSRDQDIVILFFGAIRRNKGLLEFFTSLGKIDANTDGIQFVVSGEFSEYDESDLKKILDQYKRKIKIKIINRFVDDKEKEQLFNKAHYILLPYLDDFLAQSGVVIDAYLYQKPLIVSSNPSLKYLVTHEVTGFLYEQENLKSFLEDKIHDLKQYDAYVQNIKDVLVNKYSDDPIRKRYINTYALESDSWV